MGDKAMGKKKNDKDKCEKKGGKAVGNKKRRNA